MSADLTGSILGDLSICLRSATEPQFAWNEPYSIAECSKVIA
jgi:hypothetical protein